MDNFPILTTERLSLRELSLDDAPALFAVHSDAEGMRWFGTDPMTNPSDAENMIQTVENLWLAGTGLRWAIERRSDRTFLGTCGLFKWNRGWRSCVIGYELAPFARGNGYMHEALTAAIHYGFNVMLLNRIEAQVHTQNAKSLQTLNTLGFVGEGLQRQAGYWQSAYHDLHQLALIRRDYQHPKGAVLIHESITPEY
ncbi:ribosomal-protein-alanine N-acetyltransferase [Acinetobacter calcoaceticus]|uniref:Ribosomal-protein-alanine N-acetyltransferase n=1 Tax=Acinetobacter calcoaceticus TaxID=471 RepID=A0A4R1Y0Z7_ACICA|nr:ribosomal-protein-alanine N-acetyltransferase [Acinetobacter calcoaceticus]